MDRLTVDREAYGRVLAARLPHKVQSDEDYDALAAEVEAITLDTEASAEEKAYADLAVDLLEAYERSNPLAEEATGADVLELLMEGKGLRPVDLAPVVGSRAYVSQILSGKRAISKSMARKLAEFFRVDVSVFID